MLLFVFVCLLNSSVLLGHQPGSLLHQCHSFPCQSWCLHTKLPICTLPASCSTHGCCGAQDHAPAAWRPSALCHAAWPLPAGAHCLSTDLPRWDHYSCTWSLTLSLNTLRSILGFFFLLKRFCFGGECNYIYSTNTFTPAFSCSYSVN